MTTVTKIEIAHKNDQTNDQIHIEIRETDDKARAFIVETINGVKLPAHMAFLNVVGEGDNKFMTLQAPLRKRNEAGEFETRPRMKDGKYINDLGREVAGEDEAAREFVYLTHKNDTTKLVYGQVATLNVKNTRADKTPTKVTLISAKFYTDEQALEAEKINYRMTALGKEHADYQGLKESLQTYRRENGTWHNFFINSGADILREKGFEIRVREKAPAAAMEP